LSEHKKGIYSAFLIGGNQKNHKAGQSETKVIGAKKSTRVYMNFFGRRTTKRKKIKKKKKERKLYLLRRTREGLQNGQIT